MNNPKGFLEHKLDFTSCCLYLQRRKGARGWQENINFAFSIPPPSSNSLLKI